MDAVYRGVKWSKRRVVAIVMSVITAALLAGGLGGYLVRGASTLAVTHTVSALRAAPAPEAQPFPGARTRHTIPAPQARPYFGSTRTSAGLIPGL
jgi:hypothetical protein